MMKKGGKTSFMQEIVGIDPENETMTVAAMG